MVRPARAAVVVAFLALSVASIARTAPSSAIRWHSERNRFGPATPVQRDLYSARVSMPTFDPFLFTSARHALRPGDRFLIRVGPEVTGGGRGSIVSYAAYFLMPNVMVTRPQDADVVLAFFGADPNRLGLRYSSVRSAHAHLLVARVRRGR